MLGIHTRYGLRLRDTGRPPGPEDGARNAAGFERAALEDRLAWRFMIELPDGDASEVFVDAIDGDILEVRSAVHRATGHSQYFGPDPVSLNTVFIGIGPRPYQLVDNARGGARIFLADTTVLATDADNDWGDGNPMNHTYTATSIDLLTADSQTAAVDAAYSYGVAYDTWKNAFLLDMSGWSGDGPRTDIIVHAGASAAYSAANDKIWLSDGKQPDGAIPPTTIDAIGHEFTHRVDAHTNTSGPQPTMQEGFADIFACLAKIYHRGGTTGTVIPDVGTLDDRHQSSDPTGTAGRYLYQPDLAGGPSYWYDDLDNEEIHNAGGLIARAAYFTSEGASAHINAHADPTFGSYSDYLPWGAADPPRA